MKLEDIGEFGFIKRITPDCVNNPRNVLRSIGDDAAVFCVDNNNCIVVTTDLLVERVHFLKECMSGYDVGHKALAVNLSDIAAMGASPQHAFVSVAIPKDTPIAYLDEMYTGMKSLAKKYGVNILGGDTTSSKADLVINIAVTGTAEKKSVLYRNTAQDGDVIFCTGYLGDSKAGLNFILASKKPVLDYEKYLVDAHCRPRPHVEEGLFFSSTGAVHSCIDISDGLSSDSVHIAEESGVGFIIDTDAIPISQELSHYCASAGLNPIDYALSGGEDYVLMCTVDKTLAVGFEQKFYEHFSRPLYKIGIITEEKQYRIKTPNGNIIDMKPSGWDHFS